MLVKTGSNPYGQGHHTAWAMLVSDRLGIPMDRIEVVHGDTDLIPTGAVTGGSRSVQLAGAAVHDAAGKLLDVARERAADLLEAAPDDIVLDRRRRSLPRGRHPDDRPGLGGARRRGRTIRSAACRDLAEAKATFPFGAHVAVVEVDTETGEVRLMRLVAVDDAGKILNPLLAEGQVHGGLAQGAAQALYEEVRFDEDGNPLTSNFADYAVDLGRRAPHASSGSRWRRRPRSTSSGAKGIGESGTIGSTPAVHNAVIDALQPPGRPPPRHAGHPREDLAGPVDLMGQVDRTERRPGHRARGCVVGPCWWSSAGEARAVVEAAPSLSAHRAESPKVHCRVAILGIWSSGTW